MITLKRSILRGLYLKKLFLVLILVLNLPLFSINFLSESIPSIQGKSFVNLGFVHQDISSYTNAKALNLNYSFIHQNHWGIDLGYIQSINDAKHENTNKETDFSSASLLATYLLPFTPHVGLKTKIGYAKNKHSNDGLTYGTELIFQISKNNGLGIAYQQMNENMNYVIINSVFRLGY